MKMGLNPLVKMKRDGDMGSEPYTYIQGLILNSKSAQQEQNIDCFLALLQVKMLLKELQPKKLDEILKLN